MTQLVKMKKDSGQVFVGIYIILLRLFHKNMDLDNKMTVCIKADILCVQYMLVTKTTH